MTANATFVTSTPAAAGPARTVPLGHAADTGERVDYVAATDQRACNGLIAGDAGSGTTTLANRIGQALHATGRWVVRRVGDEWLSDPAQALLALDEAEATISHRRDGDRLRLLIWDGLDRLVADRRLGHRVAARIAAVAEHGPEYGVAQLAVTGTLDLNRFAGSRNLSHLFADNLIALRACESINLAGNLVDPRTLPHGYGQALALVGDTRFDRHVVRVHLDGAHTRGCDTCWGAGHDQASADDDVFGYHRGLGLIARCPNRGAGQWRWLGVHPGDEILTGREIQELQPVPQGVTR